MSSPDPVPALYQGSRRKAAIAGLCCLGFLLVGSVLLQVDQPIRHSAGYYHVIGWGTLVVFGPFLSLATIWLLSPPRVSIDASGFFVRQPWGTKQYRWADINEVWTHYHGSHSWVVWRLNDRRNRPWWRLTRAYDGLLSGPWSHSAEAIAWEMNAARDKAT